MCGHSPQEAEPKGTGQCRYTARPCLKYETKQQPSWEGGAVREVLATPQA